jgi:oxygen-independent coproporphyrinogen-3 oxidase
LTDSLALYVHWPFCLAKCPYCDFNSHVREVIDQTRFAAALRRELASEAARLGPRRLTSIFFGGGTPSTMNPSGVGGIIDDAARWFDLAPDLEITLEANPTSIEIGRLHEYRAAGVNRVSIGVQSLNEAALQSLGRQHSATEAVAALVVARRVFPRVTFDLIYARPEQDLPSWRSELKTALAIASDHLSLYQLTIEPATRFESLHRQGKIVLPDEHLAASLYEATEEECNSAGLIQYEISNYARSGEESRHNLAYWRYLDYAGIGAGAHGRVTIDGVLHATRRHRAPEVWADRVERTGSGIVSNDEVRSDERAREALIMGLRLTEGVDLARFADRTGRSVYEAVDSTILSQCIEEGYLTQTPERLIATQAGRIRLDAVLKELLL